MTLLGLFLAVIVGLALGLLGGGGSILAVPILIYALGFGAREAVAASLAVVGVTSLFPFAEHLRGGHVRLRVALIFGLSHCSSAKRAGALLIPSRSWTRGILPGRR